MHLDEELVAEVVGGDGIDLPDVLVLVERDPREFLEELRTRRAPCQHQYLLWENKNKQLRESRDKPIHAKTGKRQSSLGPGRLCSMLLLLGWTRACHSEAHKLNHMEHFSRSDDQRNTAHRRQ